MVSDTPTDGRCNYEYSGSDDYKHDAGYCEGHPMDNGSCFHHGGQYENGSAPEGNTNSVTHGIYAEQNHFYNDVLDGSERNVVDEVFQSYYDAYEQSHGEPPLGHEIELFNIAVNIGKQLRADNWLSEKAAELESGNPLIDKETTLKAVGDQVVEERKYRESPVISAQQKLSRERRQWLKDLNLLEDTVEVTGEGGGGIIIQMADE